MKPKIEPSILVTYFIVSVLGSLLFLASTVAPAYLSLLFGLSLFLLIGMPPFHFWLLALLPSLDLPSTILFLGPMKSGYILLLLSSQESFFPLGLLAFFFGIVVVWSARCFGLIIFGSQCCHILFLLLLSSFLAHAF